MITSRDNSLLRLARSVRDGKTPGLIFAEGMRLCEEALRSGLEVEAVIVSEELAQKEKAAKLILDLGNVASKVATVSERLLESISFTKTPQGIVVLASRPASTREHFAKQQVGTPLIVIMHRLNNPVNVGAILRTAEAAGATGAIATETTSDPYSPKSLRGAMGSAFRLPLWFGATYEDALGWCAEEKIQTACAAVHASSRYDEVDWKRPSALILGPESSGLSEEEVSAATLAVTIPMDGAAESLNVAVASGILLYEAARQRNHFAMR